MLISVIAAAIMAYLLYVLNSNEDYKPKHYTLYYGNFISGNNEKYSLASGNENYIDEFLSAVTNAISEKIVQEFSINIDNMINSSSVNIENFLNKSGGNVTFYEGDILDQGEYYYG